MRRRCGCVERVDGGSELSLRISCGCGQWAVLWIGREGPAGRVVWLQQSRWNVAQRTTSSEHIQPIVLLMMLVTLVAGDESRATHIGCVSPRDRQDGVRPRDGVSNFDNLHLLIFLHAPSTGTTRPNARCGRCGRRTPRPTRTSIIATGIRWRLIAIGHPAARCVVVILIVLIFDRKDVFARLPLTLSLRPAPPRALSPGRSGEIAALETRVVFPQTGVTRETPDADGANAAWRGVWTRRCRYG